MSNPFEGRDVSKTNFKTDAEIAKKFYKDFDVAENFGGLVPTEEFNRWIFKQRFQGMGTDVLFDADDLDDMGVLRDDAFNVWLSDIQFNGNRPPWGTANGKSLWNTNRNKVRKYIKSGIRSVEFAETGLEPFCLEVKEHGQSLIITKFSDLVVDNFNNLAANRKKTIQNKAKSLGDDFKTLTEVYGVERYDAIMQNQLVEAQNKMRIAFEEACGEILNETVTKTMKAIADSKKAVQRITYGLQSRELPEEDLEKETEDMEM